MITRSGLDNLKEYYQLDKSGVYETINKFPQQLESGWHEASYVQLNFDIAKIKSIVFVGMGASNLSAKIIQSLSPYLLTLPFELVTNYRLPSYTNKHTLVILSSYSGNTEEVLSCLLDANTRKCPLVIITSGGQLLKQALEHDLCHIKLDSRLNTCAQPRYGLYLSLGAMLGLTVRLNPAIKKYLDIKKVTESVTKVLEANTRQKNINTNQCKKLAQKHLHQAVVTISANHLAGVGESAKNFLNESSKTFSANYVLPDLNHHLLDGLDFPKELKKQLKFLILNSDQYPQAIRKRLHLTQDALVRHGYQTTIVKAEAEDVISQALESLAFLILFSYYLSIANKVDPSTNPWVDYFKKHL